MLYFIFGLILGLFDFSIILGELVVGVLPGFVGGLLLVKGCALYRGKSMHFVHAEKLSWIYAGVSLVQYTVTMFNKSMQLLVFGLDIMYFGATLAAVVLILIIAYKISAGLLDMEYNLRKKINAGRVKTAWIVLTIVEAVTALFALLYSLFGDWVSDLTIFGYIVSIVYIVFVSIAFKNYARIAPND